MNRNTVLRALRLLRDEGLLEFRRGHGITVAGTPQRGAVLTQARELVRLARQHGYRRDELGQAGQDQQPWLGEPAGPAAPAIQSGHPSY
jgi:DNA-binding GntR family transcriptional regulator